MSLYTDRGNIASTIQVVGFRLFGLNAVHEAIGVKV